eukprot:CAMPEP_0197656320 /NCGR_PEP_ID=MMETSP1338-20131121/41303_1 /TAXON_ID=43686 ORGANISM="Pelagodinium beii, Strain RCC1491" /NCGR_SAMPLE_ID=MMETSP1338 /ASSEMBLY_ACC=CAM_ASM_000754 /LENGTH=520 /DNA_ID=CAMNT_0043232267 /DNA_START=104 /DNA_END=1666 /DNA_ORIENTATION=-
MAVTQRKAEALAAVQAVVDPGNRFGSKRVLAAITSMGLEPEDIDGSRDADITVSSLIPDKKRVQVIAEERREVREGLLKARLHELTKLLENFSDTDERRYLRTRPGEGVRMVLADDVGDVTSLEGMGSYEELQKKVYDKIQAEQQRKANLLVSGFMMEKKRMDEADANIEALEQRLRDYRKAQEEASAARKKEALKEQEKRQANVRKAMKERADWEEKTYDNLMNRLTKARATRAKNYSKDTLAEKQADSEAKRQRCYDQAQEIQQQLLDKIESSQRSLEERLELRRQEVEEEMTRKREEGQAKFQERQVRIYAHTQDWVEKKLDAHAKFKEQCDTAIKGGKDFMKTRSKSTGDITKKAHDKWQSNYNKIMGQQNKDNDALMTKHQNAATRTEERMALKLKCGGDVHSFREIKHGTWGELQQRRYTELKNHRDAETMAGAIKAAELNAKAQAMKDGNAETRRRRQNIGRETLALNDNAKEGFLKIKAEPDEMKIRKVMQDLGFAMPKLPDEEDEEEGKAF